MEQINPSQAKVDILTSEEVRQMQSSTVPLSHPKVNLEDADPQLKSLLTELGKHLSSGDQKAE